jgi:hypothetical protein
MDGDALVTLDMSRNTTTTTRYRHYFCFGHHYF